MRFVFWGFLFVYLLACLACSETEDLLQDVDIPTFSITKNAHEATHHSAKDAEHRGIQAAPDAVNYDLNTVSGIDAWESDQIAECDRKLSDGEIDEATHARKIANIKSVARHDRERINIVTYWVAGGIVDPDDNSKNLKGWQVHVVFVDASEIDEDFFFVSGSDYEIQDFRSNQRKDGNWIVSFFIATQAHRKIFDFPGLVNSISLEGN